MANLATVYANAVGVKLPATPEDFPTAYIEIPDKYIVIYTGGSSQALKYNYYNEVLSFIRESLGDIKILHIGIPTDPSLDNIIDYRGKSNFRQTAFIIENSLLFVGNDSTWHHVAGAKKVPFVVLTGATPDKSIEPYYKDKFSIINGLPSGVKPSYDPFSNDINLIKPETVAAHIANHLGINWSKTINTIRVGKLYNIKQIDYIPDFPVGLELQGKKIIVRFDICNNFNNLVVFYNQLSGPLVTKDPVPPTFIDSFKDKIPEIIYFCDDNFNINFIRKIHSAGIKYSIITSQTGRELSELKLQLLDLNPPLTKIPKDVSFLPKNCYFKTNRLFLGRGRYYPSLSHYRLKEDIDSSNFSLDGFINDDEFLESLESLYIFQKDE